MAPRKTKQRAGPERNVDRMVRLFRWVGSRKGEFGIPELCEALDLSHATARRWLAALEAEGFVSRRLETAPSSTRGSGYRLRAHFKLTEKPR